MRKICSDGHNTHDANRRTMAGGGIDFAAHFIQIVPTQLFDLLFLLRFI